MSEVITHEIDLRPMWIQGLGKKSPSRAKSVWFIGGGVALLAVAMFAFSKDRDPAPKRTNELAVAGVVASEKTHETAKVAPEKNDAPIVIHATRELDVQPPSEKSVVVERSVSTAGFGKLKLDSDPSVAVYKGERRLGSTPLTVSLEAGVHELKFVDKAKHLEVKRRFEVRANGNHEREMMFGIGALRVDAPEGTKLWLNKKYVGEAPFKRIALADGRHRIKVVKGSEVVDEWINIPASNTVDYRVNFAD